MNQLFICGAARSGTTLLADVVGTHTELSPIYETNFVIKLCVGLQQQNKLLALNDIKDTWEKISGNVLTNAGDSFKHGVSYQLYDKEYAYQKIDEAIAQINNNEDSTVVYKNLIESLFTNHAEKDNKPYWISKTPLYAIHLQGLLSMFPDMKIINCIRDGRDVACSTIDRSFGPNLYDELASWWMYPIKMCAVFKTQHPNQILDVKYEDLINDTENTLNAIFAWIGVEENASEVMALYNITNQIHDNSIGSWQSKMTVEDKNKFESIANNMLNLLGYE